MTVKVLISVREEQLRKLDAMAKASGKSRSAYLVEAALATTGNIGPRRPIDDPRVRHAYEGILDARKRWKPGQGTTAMIRAMRGARY